MEGNLYIDLRINEEGNISIIDNSLYERWFVDYASPDEFDDLYKEALNKRAMFECVWKVEPGFKAKLVMTDNWIMGSVKNVHAEHIVKLDEAGLYCYQRVIIPTEIDNVCGFYYDVANDKILTDEGEEVDMWVVFAAAKRGEYELLYWEKHFLNTFYLEECYLTLERERINNTLIGCSQVNCNKNSSLTARADLLLGILILIENLKRKDGGLEEAAVLISRLGTCNGICPEMKTKVKRCGCGSNH